MIDTKIEKLREELHELIKNKSEFEEIQRISHLLDECLVEYYDVKKE